MGTLFCYPIETRKSRNSKFEYIVFLNFFFKLLSCLSVNGKGSGSSRNELLLLLSCLRVPVCFFFLTFVSGVVASISP